MPEFRASVIFCSTLSRLLGPGENFFVANCSQDFSTNIFMSFKSKCIMCHEKPHQQKDPAQQKKSSHAELWLFPGEICSGGQVAQSYSITYYNRVHNHVLQHNGEWQQPNHSCFFIWSHLPDKNMSILVSDTEQGRAHGSWSCCLHCYNTTVFLAQFWASFQRAPGQSLGVCRVQRHFQQAVCLWPPSLETEFRGMNTCCAIPVCPGARGKPLVCLLE